MPHQSLISPGLVQGFSSSLSPFALPQGIMENITNGRLMDRTLSVRPGGAILSTTGSLGAPRGLFPCTMNGTNYVYASSVSAGGHTSLYVSTDGGVTFTLISQAVGPYGNTVMTDTGYPVSFAVVNDNAPLGQIKYDCLIVGNGVDQNRIYAPANANTIAGTGGTPLMSVMKQPPIVNVQFNNKQSISTSFVNSVYMNGVTTSNSQPSQFLLGPSPFYVLDISETSTATVGDTGTMIFAAPLNASASPQVILGFALQNITGTLTDIGTIVRPEDFQISVTDGTHTDVVWGSSGGLSSTFYVDLGGGETEYQFHYYDLVITVGDLPTVNPAAITKIIFNLQVTHGVTTTSPQVIGFIGFFGATGNIQLGSNIKVALYSADNRTVGSSFEFPMVDGGIQDGLYTGSAFEYSPPTPLKDPRVYTAYTLNLTEPLLIPGPFRGYDTVNIYAEQLGQSGFYLVAQYPVATYSSGSHNWTYASFSQQITSIAVQDFNFADPQASCQSMPPGIGLATQNGRLLIGAGNTFWYSEFNNPFLYYQSPVTSPVTNQIDTLSGGSRLFAGEIISAFVVLGAVASATQTQGAPVTGSSTLYILTQSNLYQVGGYDAISMAQASLVSPHGTFSPWSIARNENRFYWLDNQMQVRVCEWGYVRCLSLEVVDSYTMGIPLARLGWVAGTCTTNRYFMAFSSPAGYTNSNILVYSEIRAAWESIDVPAGYSCETLTTWLDQGNDLLRILASDFNASNFRVVQHAKPGVTSDPGSAGVAFSVTCPTIRKDFMKNLMVTEAAIFADSIASGSYTLTVSRLGINTVGSFPNIQADANPAVGTIPIANIGYTNAYDQEGIGIMDVAVAVTLSGTLPGGWGLYNAMINVDEASSLQTIRP